MSVFRHLFPKDYFPCNIYASPYFSFIGLHRCRFCGVEIKYFDLSYSVFYCDHMLFLLNSSGYLVVENSLCSVFK
jgi:hypothetical protein